MVVFGIHIGETQASWERQKLVPESLDDACALSSSGRADGALSRPGKAAASWQVWSHAITEDLADLAEAGGTGCKLPDVFLNKSCPFDRASPSAATLRPPSWS